MASTTLKVDREQKRRLDRLRARLRILSGRRTTHAEVIDRMLALAESSPGTLLPCAWRPLSRSEIDKVLSLSMDLGFQLGDVDEVLYGKRKRSRS